MTDRELLELAAKAAGYKVHGARQAERDIGGYGHVGLWLRGLQTCWNSLTDDGDAFRLAVMLGMEITIEPEAGVVTAGRPEVVFVSERFDNIAQANHFAATRRAITLCAAAALGGDEGRQG